jgi:hypothetical protein
MYEYYSRLPPLCKWDVSLFWYVTQRRMSYTIDVSGPSYQTHIHVSIISGFGSLEVACWPLVPKFARSDPAEAVEFFRANKSSARLPSEGK